MKRHSQYHWPSLSKVLIHVQTSQISVLWVSNWTVVQGVTSACFPPFRTTSPELSPCTRAPAALAAWTLRPAWRNESPASPWLPLSLPTTGGQWALVLTHTQTVVRVEQGQAQHQQCDYLHRSILDFYLLLMFHTCWSQQLILPSGIPPTHWEVFLQENCDTKRFVWAGFEKKTVSVTVVPRRGWGENAGYGILNTSHKLIINTWGLLSLQVRSVIEPLCFFPQEQQGSCGKLCHHHPTQQLLWQTTHT